MDTLNLKHEPFCMVDSEPTSGKSVGLYALWEQPNESTKELFGKQVKPTLLSKCEGCVWKNDANSAQDKTCTGMSCDEEIGAYKREVSGEINQGYQICAEATITFPDERAKAIYLREQTAIHTSPGAEITHYVFDPTLPCAQKAEVTAQLA